MRDLISLSIREGHINPDAPLAEDDLVRLFDSSRSSVRTALTQLSDSGFVERKRRVGTTVTSLGVRIPLTDIRVNGGTQSIDLRVHEDRLVPSFPLVRERLQIDDGTVRMIENTFVTEGEVFGLRTAYFSEVYASDPWAKHGPVSMFDVMTGFFDTTPGRVEVSIGSDNADAHTAKTLGIAEGRSLIVREMTYFSDEGVPIELVFDRFCGDRVRLDASVAIA
ncbi:hypothetical protein AX769_17320 [Frondihabitans sp. PAMC 28766]|nr:hypothetical protein AX769_17320 [Frondihabitans sp. PAMC 28766]